MQVTITPGAVQAACAVLMLIAGFSLWAIRAIVRAENAKQLRDINGTYVRSAGSKITGAEIERRLGHLDGLGAAAQGD